MVLILSLKVVQWVHGLQQKWYQTDFVYGVACLSYPLHTPRKTSELRVSPLLHVGVPVLFINGRKDPFCRADLMENTALNRMANDWTMHWVDSADHELKVNGKVNNEIISNMCEWFVQWCQSVFMAERSSLCCFSSGTGLGRKKT